MHTTQSTHSLQHALAGACVHTSQSTCCRQRHHACLVPMGHWLCVASLVHRPWCHVPVWSKFGASGLTTVAPGRMSFDGRGLLPLIHGSCSCRCWRWTSTWAAWGVCSPTPTGSPSARWPPCSSNSAAHLPCHSTRSLHLRVADPLLNCPGAKQTRLGCTALGVHACPPTRVNAIFHCSRSSLERRTQEQLVGCSPITRHASLQLVCIYLTGRASHTASGVIA